MNKRELLTTLKDNMPKFEGNEDEKELKLILYIYIELAKIKSFDERYYFGNSEMMRKVYAESKREAKDVNLISKKRKIICVTLSKLYCSILKEFGVSCEIIKDSDYDSHVYPLITLKNGKKIIADIQADMHNVQTRSRLRSFKFKTDNGQDEQIKNLDEMLQNLGYINDKKDYKDEKIASIKKQTEKLNAIETLKIVLEDEEITNIDKNMGIVELYKYYSNMLHQIMPNYVFNKVFYFYCRKPNEVDREKDQYTMCIFADEPKIEEMQIYLFSKKKNKFLECDSLKLEELQNEGFILGKNGKENGVKRLKKYIEKQKNKNSQKNIDFLD